MPFLEAASRTVPLTDDCEKQEKAPDIKSRSPMIFLVPNQIVFK